MTTFENAPTLLEEFHTFLEEVGRVNPKVIDFMTKTLLLLNVQDFVKKWTFENYKLGMKNDIVDKFCENNTTDMDPKLEVARLRVAWKFAAEKMGMTDRVALTLRHISKEKTLMHVTVPGNATISEVKKAIVQNFDEPSKWQTIALITKDKDLRLLHDSEHLGGRPELWMDDSRSQKVTQLIGITKLPSIKFTYFDVEGGGECIRLAFALGGVPYIDDRIDMATQWKDLKPTVPFGQLPVMTIDGSAQIAQSHGMLRFACQLGNLIPKDHVGFLKTEEVLGLSWDMVDAITPSMQLDRRPYLYGCEGTPQEELTKKAVEMRTKLSADDGEINRFLGYLDGLLAKNGTGWFVGKNPGLAECEVVPRLRNLRKGNRDGFPKTIVDKHTNLMKMYWDFHELPQIKAHYKSEPPY